MAGETINKIQDTKIQDTKIQETRSKNQEAAAA